MFDIDKLYLYIPNSYRASDGSYIYIEEANWENQYNDYKSQRIPNLISALENIIESDLNESTKSIIRSVLNNNTDNFNINDFITDLSDLLESKRSIPNSGQVQVEIMNIIDATTTLIENNDLDTIFMNKDRFRMKAIENGIQEVQTDILTLKENYSQLIAPIKSDTLEGDAIKINNLRRNQYPFDAKSKLEIMLDRSYLTSLNDSFLGGKVSIGISALYNTFHIMASMNDFQINNLELALPHNKSNIGGISLGKLTTADGKQYIPDLLNQWVSAGADVVKKPYMIDLNASPQTLNTFLFLTTAGVPSYTTALFMNQPIIRRYLELQNIFESQVAEANDIGKNRSQLKNAALGEFKGKVFKSLPISFENNMLEEMISIDNLTDVHKQHQRNILNEFLKYQDAAKKVGEAIQATTYDTGDGGINTAQLIYKTLLTQKVIDEGFITNFDRLLNTGFISPYYNVVSELTEIFRPLYVFLQDDDFYGPQGIMNRVISLYLDDNTRVSRDDIIRVANKFKQDYLNNIILTTSYDGSGRTIAQLAPDLMQGEFSLPKFIRELKTMPQFADNAFLNTIEPILNNSSSGYDYLRPLHGKLETIELNEVIQSFDNISNLPYQDRTVGEALTLVALIQSGLNNSPMSILDLIPANIYNYIVKPIVDKANTTRVDYRTLYNSFWAANYNDRAIGIRTKGVNSKSPIPLRVKYTLKPEYERANRSQITAALEKGEKVFNDTPILLMPKSKPDGSSYFIPVPGNYSTVNFRRNESRIFYGSDSQRNMLNQMIDLNIDPYADYISTELNDGLSDDVNTIIEDSSTPELRTIRDTQLSLFETTVLTEEEVNNITEEFKHCN